MGNRWSFLSKTTSPHVLLAKHENKTEKCFQSRRGGAGFCTRSLPAQEFEREEKRGVSRPNFLPQRRPQGLLAFQYGGGRSEDVFSTAAARLESEKTLGTRLFLPLRFQTPDVHADYCTRGLIAEGANVGVVAWRRLYCMDPRRRPMILQHSLATFFY